MFRILLPSIFLVAVAGCNSSSSTQDMMDFIDPFENNSGVLAQEDLLGVEWTLETVRDTAGAYLPFPLSLTLSLNFDASGSVSGAALCNQGNGSWQAGDSTLSIIEWSQDEAFCESSEIITTTARQAIINRLLQGETVMPLIDAGRLVLNTGDGVQLVFSGRATSEGEQSVPVETLLSTGGSARAAADVPVFGDSYVVYRDTESLETDYALLPAETSSWPALPPGNDFTSGVVIGAYLRLHGSTNSFVFVRSAHLSPNGLEISVARSRPDVQEEVPVSCIAGDSLTAPYTLVRVDSIAEPIKFTEVVRAACSGIPVEMIYRPSAFMFSCLYSAFDEKSGIWYLKIVSYYNRFICRVNMLIKISARIVKVTRQ